MTRKLKIILILIITSILLVGTTFATVIITNSIRRSIDGKFSTEKVIYSDKYLNVTSESFNYSYYGYLNNNEENFSLQDSASITLNLAFNELAKAEIGNELNVIFNLKSNSDFYSTYINSVTINDEEVDDGSFIINLNNSLSAFIVFNFSSKEDSTSYDDFYSLLKATTFGLSISLNEENNNSYWSVSKNASIEIVDNSFAFFEHNFDGTSSVYTSTSITSLGKNNVLDITELLKSGIFNTTITKNSNVVSNMIDCGDYYINISNSSRSISVKHSVNPRDISECQITYDLEATYTGSEIRPQLTIMYFSEEGIEYELSSSDYDVTFDNNVNAGVADIIISGKGNFTGSVTKNFTINKAEFVIEYPTDLVGYVDDSLSSIEIPSNENGVFEFKTPDTLITLPGKNLYSMIFTPNDTNNYLVGEADVYVTCYKLVDKPEADATEYTYNGNNQSYKLDPSIYYEIFIENLTKKDAGEYPIRVRLSNDYYLWDDKTSNDLTYLFTINKKDLTISGNEIETDFMNFVDLNSDNAYTITGLEDCDTLQSVVGTISITTTYKIGSNVGTYAVAIIPEKSINNNYNIETTPGSIHVIPSSITNYNVALDKNKYTYTGEEVIAVPILSLNGFVLADFNYELEYSNNINSGTATVVITGIGNYDDSISVNYVIEKAPCEFDISIVYSHDAYYSTSETIKLSVSSNSTGILTISGANYNIVSGNNNINVIKQLAVGNQELDYTFVANDSNIEEFTKNDSLEYSVYATVSFKYQTTVEKVYVEGGSKVSAIEPFEVLGYEFDNWYVNNVVYDFDSTVNSDLIIEARYNIITYTVTYILNSGIIEGENTYSETYTVNTIPYSITNKVPTRTDYLFDGWYDNEDFDNKYVDSQVLVSSSSNLANFIIYAKWIYDGTIEIGNIVQTNAIVTYNAQDQQTNLQVYDSNNVLIAPARYSVVYMLDGDDVTPNIVGTYTIKLRFVNEGVTKEVDIDKTFVIQQKTITVIINSVPDKYYDGTTSFNNFVGINYTMSGVISGDDISLSIVSGTYDNKNCGSRTITFELELTGDDSNNYIVPNSVSATGNINPKEVTITGNLAVDNALSINYSSPTEFANFVSSVTVTFSDTVDEYNIESMYDGTFMYGTVVSGVSYKYTSANYRYVAGSTYIAIVDVSSNYILSGSNQIYIKYKTTKVGSTFYTVEDAIASSGTTAICFAGNDTTTEKDVQITTFSKILSTTSYTNSNHNIIVSYASFGTQTSYLKTAAASPTSTNTSCVLYIPEGITLTSQKDVICNGELAAEANTGVHGVIMNNGVINISTTLTCYGYIKGNGMINVQSGGEVIDILKYYDYPGSASTAYSLSSKVFPMYEWILNNISCATKIYNGATLSASTCVWGTSVGFNMASGLLVGTSSDSNCLFKPTTNNSSHYILKKTAASPSNNWNTAITSSNQSKVGLSDIEVYGNYQDSTLSISVYVTFKTSTSIPLPLSYTNIHVLSGSNLTLSKSSFIFMNGTKLTVDSGSNVTISGSSYVAFDKMNGSGSAICTGFSGAKILIKESAKMVLNGTLSGTGYAGGIIDTSTSGAVINLSNRYIPANKIPYKPAKNSNATYTSDYYIYLITYNDSTGKFNTVADVALTTKYISSSIDGKYGWLETTSTISYNTNCSLTVDDRQISMSESGHQLSGLDLPTLSRDYYTFDGWFIDSAFTISATNHTVYSSALLYAKWTPNTYNINYIDKYFNDFDSGNKSTNTNISTFTYETDMVLTDPTNGDYVFGGWYLDASCTLKINILNGSQLVNYLSSNSVTVYILWYNEGAEKYIVYFNNTNEAITCPDSDTIIGSDYNWSSYSLPVMTENDNDYNIDIYFDGWYNGSTKVTALNINMFIFNDATQAYEISLDAHWENKNSLEVIAQGFGTIMTVYYKSGYSFTVPSLESKGIYLGKDGLVLINWVFNNNTTCVSGELVTLNTQTTLTANIKQFVQFKIGTNSYTTVTATLTSGQGYIVEYDPSTKISSATAFTGQTKTNNATFYVTVGSKFAAKYAYSGNNNDGKATITGTTPTTALTTSNQTYTVTGAVTITPSGTKSCLLPNTLVAMADGSFKEIQYILPGEMVMVFNHETGKLDVAPVIFNES